MEEKISILMTSYNYAQYIAEAIESVINQTYTNWELLIIDDASSDNSLEIIEQYVKKDNRIKLIINEVNLGLGKSIEKCLNFAEGNWIAFLESDDIFTPNSLEEKVKNITEDTGIIYSNLHLIGDAKNISNAETYFKMLSDRYGLNHSQKINNFRKIITQVNIIPTFSVVMIKKELLLQCSFNSRNKASLDYYLWAQLSTKTEVYYIHQKLTKWRMHDSSYLNKYKYSWLKGYLFSIDIYKETIKDKPILLKIILTLNYMRARLIYIKISKEKIKINLLNNKYIFEKFLS